MKKPEIALSLSLDKASIVMRVKECFQLWCSRIVPHMPRTSRYTTGTRIETHFLDLLELMYQAYYAPIEKKMDILTNCISKADLLKYLIQIAWENKFIQDGPYLELSEKLQESGKMLYGWKNKIEKNISLQKNSRA